jgi:hypothetical protein
MPWLYVVIDKTNADATRGAAEGLLKDFTKTYIAADFPNGVEVWGRSGPDFQHHYLFSPTAASCAPDLIRSYGAVVFADKPDLAGSGFKRLVI